MFVFPLNCGGRHIDGRPIEIVIYHMYKTRRPPEWHLFPGRRCLKARFHEATNHDDERDKTADDQNKLVVVTDIIGRTTNIL